MLSALIIYLGIGVLAGILAGLLGVGGGLIIVPALAITFVGQGVPDSVLMHSAVGTSLATIVITSLASIRAHHKRGAVRWHAVFRLTPGIALGAFAGAGIASELPGDTLRVVFGLFALSVAAQMGFGLRPAAHRQLPGMAGISAAGGIIGALSAIVGIGGGSLSVPFLTWCNVPVRQAVATSAACGLPIAIAGAAGYMVTGWNATDLPAFSSGFIYWPGFLGIVTTSMLFAGIGAGWAHSLPAATLKRLFALFLCCVGVYLLAGMG